MLSESARDKTCFSVWYLDVYAAQNPFGYLQECCSRFSTPGYDSLYPLLLSVFCSKIQNNLQLGVRGTNQNKVENWSPNHKSKVYGGEQYCCSLQKGLCVVVCARVHVCVCMCVCMCVYVKNGPDYHIRVCL